LNPGRLCWNKQTAVKSWICFSVPKGIANPVADGVNASVMSIRWQPPAQINGPSPTYSIRRYSPAFSIPPQSVERGYHFTGLNYFMFAPETIPLGVTFTGKRSTFFLFSQTRCAFRDVVLLLLLLLHSNIDFLDTGNKGLI
jgi:hypothetical protein